MKAFSSTLLGYVLAAIVGVFRRKFPPIVRIETTNLCNATCTFCPRESIGREMGFMDQGLYEKIITDCADNGCSTIHLNNFGEPLLDKRLPERIRFAKERGIRWIKIFTNGTLLKGEKAERLLDSGLDEIRISIDGASALEFNELRRGIDHAEIVENSRNFKLMRDARGSKRPVIVATCVRTSNRRNTNDMLIDAVDSIIFSELHNWAGERGFSGNWQVRQPCFRLWQTFTILVDGKVALCCLDHAAKEILGNCRDQEISQIWENHRYQELRRLHRTSEQHKIPLCSRCSMCFFRPTWQSFRDKA